ncbi:xanthine dehydrogenase family protein molybdopterin-binding subunit [Govanella unica]|uniref:Xanthine dehydrogenase family protein molybdopterin-binding subunit n=1 Tax=Govanella unica TaxID=2975056 RepID=A0A9X3TWG7_9PROT|nr:xanthine dehydrogenase family protein molybdopterin-binding subunit [Govania unica]MDA5192908.1 xanthine dehydrogenase family protein molybdopterin-binding subunit [Govania unica]
MKQTANDKLMFTRRDFSKLGGVGLGAMLLGFWITPGRVGQALAATDGGRDFSALMAAYIEITPDNIVHLVTPEAEMGQGVQTSLPAILAEELEADWARVVVRLSGAGEIYNNPEKKMQATGRSLAVRGYFELLREVGATARMMLCQAAAASWQADLADCYAEQSHVIHRKTGARLRYADLVEAAAKLPLPAKVTLKSPRDFKIIGHDIARKDIPDKVTGRATFGVDVMLPDMLVASVAMPPAFGGTLVSFDEAAALAVPGVVAAVRISTGLAVAAQSYWQARQGIEAAQPQFDAGPNGEKSSDDVLADLKAGLSEPGIEARKDGSLDALATAATRLGGDYTVPYLAHTTMEPMSCTAHVRADGCELWTPSQGPVRARDDVAKLLGIDPSKVKVNRTFLGGGFGRRWQTDFATQAVEISRAVKKPVKLIWSREEDVQHDYYRPAFAMRFDAGLTAKGKLESLHIRVSGASIGEWGKPPRPGVLDRQATSGLSDSHYRIPNFQVECVTRRGFVPIGTWRSVGHSQNGFFFEGMIDELAHAAKADPLAFRRELIGDHPRFTPLFEEITRMSNWKKSPAKGRVRGIAVTESYGSYVAEVIEISVSKDKKIKIHNINCVIDCGFAVNPAHVARQMESGIIYGLSAAMTGKITIANGAVEQSNFHDYPALAMAEVPPITVKVLANAKELNAKEIGGAGEPGLPPIAPALVNAIFAATGERIRDLPLADHGYELV